MKYLVIIIISLLGLTRVDQKLSFELASDTPVIEVLEQLGESYADKKPKTSIAGVSAAVGESLFHTGLAPKPQGGTTKKQSKHFVCTSCHNVVQEDPDLAHPDPQSRLEYSELRGIPYLQGTTMYGAVNRQSYYNGDYYKKYGELVEPARKDIRAAIQLCATECAQGRELNDWELESILSYLWELQYTMDDLSLSPSQLSDIQEALDQGKPSSKAVEILHSGYALKSEATFIPPPADRKVGTGLTGNPENGRLVYENSCLHCHYNGRYSYFSLDDHKFSFTHLNKHMDRFTRHSIYQVIRWGVPVKSGKASYMPQYTSERMSDQQLADLRAYIKLRAE